MSNISDFFTWDKMASIGSFILKPLIIFALCKIIIAILMKIATKIIGKTKLESGIQGFIKSALKIVLWSLSIILIADSLGVNTTSLVAILSVASLALSLAFQNIMTNVFSGITILLSKPFVVGNYIEAAGVGGTVKSIGLMRTVLTTPDGREELIPNGDIAAQKISNYSVEPMRRVEIRVSTAYDAPTEQVKNAVLEVIGADNRIKTDEEIYAPFVNISAFNANDIEYVIRVWVDNTDYWGVYFDTLEAIRESFSKHNIEFSYPHTVVHIAQ